MFNMTCRDSGIASIIEPIAFPLFWKPSYSTIPSPTMNKMPRLQKIKLFRFDFNSL